ncbi:glycoside hydrolase family 66 protein [Flavobacterium sp. ZT3R17]|uniref:glycoside hydrolase family 66 protein n=1 Tax=Flavobacterium cryoconiti TaxID=3398736 RepID=UPI003A8C56E1
MKRKNASILKSLLLALLFINCDNNDKSFNYTPEQTTTAAQVVIKTDKAKYAPGDQVTFSVDKVSENSIVRYKYLNTVLSEQPLTSTNWIWTPPSDDYKGYLVELYKTVNGVEVIVGTVGVDVSSDWAKFPRYGFLSHFDNMSDSQMTTNIDVLKDYHINGLQFYDWSEKHHKPLAGTVTNPSDNWLDIAKRPTYKSTVQGYINKAHQSGIRAMSYNLCYGALNDAAADGVLNQWYMFKDASHTQKAVMDAGSFLKSPIYLLDPSNTNWQQYIAAKNSDLYAVYDFDGYHIDQLGDWGTVYNYDGGVINLAAAFNPFIKSMKAAHPSKKLVFNAVNQFGQQGSIATAPVDFLYSEVWGPNDGFKDLATIIQANNTYSDNKLNTVLAAYMNYNKANSAGFFNTPSVLLTDAVIFAFGGSHLELGEHMLGKEYFPNNNLQMDGELKKNLPEYYDFLVAYQNLLRDGGVFNNPVLISGDGKVSLNSWPPVSSSVSVVGKKVGNKQIVHLINFSNANSLNWRDTNGEQVVPDIKKNLTLNLQNNQTISKVWYASPDLDGGASKELSFSQVGSYLVFKIPSLQYWGMIVVEYK